MIPVVDCSNGVAEAGGEILKAIESVGFVYLKNYGIDKSLVDKVLAVSDKFWQLDLDVKNKYARPTAYDKGNTGYVAPGVEMLDPNNKAEIREAYNVTPKDGLFLIFPDEELPEFRSAVLDFYDRCWGLARELLQTLAIQLKLSDVDIFEKTHNCAGTGNNATTLRLLHYPPLPDQIAAGTVRCGEHSDYGTITLLFQDEVGGLEVKGRDGKFVPALPEPGAVLINTGDLLQRWTDDRILAVKHRVLVPEDRGRWKDERRSLAFFVHPNDDAVVQPLNGSHSYQPITAKQHLLNMFSKTY